MGFEGDVLVLGADGSALDPNLKIKGFSVFGATQAAYTGASAGPGNVVVNGVLAVSSGAYFVGNSTFTAANKIFVNDGTPGQILRKNAAGYLDWDSASSIGDNLGNHTATQALDLNGQQIVNISSLTLLATDVNPAEVWVSTSVITPHLYITTAGYVGIGTASPGTNKLSVVGNSYASGSLTAGGDITAQGGDILDNSGDLHVSGEDSLYLKMDYNNDDADTRAIVFAKNTGLGAAPANANELMRLTEAGNLGISTGAPQARLDLRASAVTPDIMAQIWRGGDGVIVGSMSATGVLQAVKILGDISGATGLPTGDNLGNHTATEALKMGAYGVNTSSNITAASYQINGSTMVAILAGTGSIAYGVGAGASNVAGGDDNTFIGSYAGELNTTGSYNTASGFVALNSNTTGGNNAVYGAYALNLNTSGNHNTANGYSALGNNTAGNYNSANGSGALSSNITGEYNTANGYSSIQNNETGSANAALGMYAGNGVFGQSFSSATLVGYKAGFGLTTGSDNTFLGWQAGYTTTTGTRNLVIGYDQRTSAPAASNELNIGGVLFGKLDTKTIGISTRNPQAALDVVSTGTTAGEMAQLWRNSAGVIVGSMSATGVLQAVKILGDISGASGLPTGDNLGNHTATQDLLMGGNDIYNASTISATGNITAASYQINGSTMVAILAGVNSIAYGVGAGGTAGNSNTFTGNYAGKNNTGNANTVNGKDALYFNTSGSFNTAIGMDSFYYNQTGSYNTALGYQAGSGTSGNSFSNSVLIGSGAGYSLTTGNDNIMMGWQAGYATTSGARNIVVGYDQRTSAPTASNELNIGGVLFGKLDAKTIGISTRNPQAALDVVSTGTTAGEMAQLWRNSAGVIVGSMSATGVLQAVKILGDISGASGLPTGDNLGNHTATEALKMGAYGINSSSSVTAAYYQINGSTMVAVLPGTDSIAYGIGAGRVNQGSYNIFVGDNAGSVNANGFANAFVGSMAGASNIDGYYNVSMGRRAGYSNTMGHDNSMIGAYAGDGNTTGTENTAVGSAALMDNGTGSANTVLGAYAADSSSSFSSSTLVGYMSGRNMSTGSDNIFLGWQAGYATTTGARNIVVGYDQRTSAPTASNELNIGGVLYGNLSAKTIGISTRNPQAALDVVSTGTTAGEMAQLWRNSAGVIVGSMSATGVLQAVKILGDISGASGLPTGDNLGNHTATQALKMGPYGVNTSSAITAAYYQINGSTVLSLLPGSNSFGAGLGAGKVNTASYNSFVGDWAGFANTTGAGNTFVGEESGYSNISGGNNSFIGVSAGWENTTGTDNTYVGRSAGISATGSKNSIFGTRAGAYSGGGPFSNSVIIGYDSANRMETGGENVVIGNGAAYWSKSGSANVVLGYFAGNASSSSSTIIGYQAGYDLADGANDNIFLGWQAGYTTTTGTRNLIVGYDQRASAPTASNELNIGGVLFGKLDAKTIGISTRNPQAALDVVSTGTTAGEMAQLWRNSAGVIVGSMSATGVLQAVKILGDISGASGLPTGDNLGNHTATQDLKMQGLSIVNAASGTFTQGVTASSFTATGPGLMAAQLRFNPASGNIVISSETSAALGGGVRISTNVYIVGFSSAAKYYGDGSSLTGIAGDNLGNHLATQDLNMNGNDVLSVGSMTMVGKGLQIGTDLTASASGIFISTNSSIITLGAGTGTIAPNARGFGAVDLQTYRISATNVASGQYSVISGGKQNTAGGTYDAVSGGYNNLTTAGFSAQTISGGQNNIASANNGTISGGIGNIVLNYADTVAGGDANVASGGRSFVAGGWQNTASGSYSFAAGYKSSSTIAGAFTWSDSGGQVTQNSVTDRAWFKSRGGFLVTGSTNPAMSGTLDRGVLITGNGLVGISTGVPYAALDVVSTGTTAGEMAQLWRNSAGVIVGSMSATGVLQAVKILGDISGASGLPTGDNLGNHTATQDLKMQGFSIVNAASGTFTQGVTASSFTATGPGLMAAQLRFNPASGNIVISSETSAALGGGVRISTNVYIVGFSSAAKYYGDGSSLTGIAGDNLGNHLATQDLLMGGNDIYNASTITATGNITAARYQINGSTVLAILPGAESMAVGDGAGRVDNGLRNTFVGYHSGYNNTASGNTFVGRTAGTSNTTGSQNVFVGDSAGYFNTTSSNNTIVGGSAGMYVTGGENSIFGAFAGDANPATGSSNSFFGSSSGGNTTSGSYNSFFGMSSGGGNTTGNSNTANGYQALYSNTTGSNNTANGSGALMFNTTGRENTANGTGALSSNTTGRENTVNGFNSGFRNVTGSANAILGFQSGYGVAANSYSSSTLVGYQSGFSLTTGGDNIFLGWQAGYNVTSGTGNIVIGYNDNTSAPTASNELVIGEVLYGKLDAKTIGISTRNPQAALDVVSTGTAANQMAQIWRDSGGTIVSSMSATGVMMATKFIGDGSSLANISANASVYTLAQMNTLVPAAAGRLISVSDASAPYSYCVSTGTAAGAWVMLNQTLHCR